VRWVDTIRYLWGQDESMVFTEVGPGKVLTKLTPQIQEFSTPLKQLASNFESFPTGGKQLGNTAFKQCHQTQYAYVTGSMYRGIASVELVARATKAGFLSFFGTGGLSLNAVESAIQKIQSAIPSHVNYGMNLLNDPDHIEREWQLVELYQRYQIHRVEASAYLQNLSKALVYYRLQGLTKTAQGDLCVTNKILAKVSRPEVAEAFMSPPPEKWVQELVNEGKVTTQVALWAKQIAMADDVCVEADSAGHTDRGMITTLLPSILRLREEKATAAPSQPVVRVGAAGGMGSPEAIAAACFMGADFILTGSINQCTVEAGTSEAVKDLLMHMAVQDTDYAPAGDMFELGAKVQVLKKGVLFAARANKLYDLYRLHASWEDIDPKTRTQVEAVWQRSFDEIAKELLNSLPELIVSKARKSAKAKMAMVFKWYFGMTTQAALDGDLSRKVDFQIHCGSSMGAFNAWVGGAALSDWSTRHVDDIGKQLMDAAATLLNQRIQKLQEK
jgi:trans-AT polyketide synthase, acyltransferase and oxidoreductase domains